MLCVLMDITINDPEELPDEEVEEIALKWLQQKKRRKVSERGAANLREVKRRAVHQKELKRKRELGQSTIEFSESVEDISDND